MADTNGTIAAGKTKYRVALTFEDGEMAWCAVQPASASPEAAEAKEAPPQHPRVNFLGKWMGYEIGRAHV